MNYFAQKGDPVFLAIQEEVLGQQWRRKEADLKAKREAKREPRKGSNRPKTRRRSSTWISTGTCGRTYSYITRLK